MKLIIDIDENFYGHIKRYCEIHGEVDVIYSYISHGIPLNKNLPVIINEDGKSAYLTQGHIDALLEYEDKQRQERVMRDVIDVIRKVNNNDPV